jgi:hypothetical protein
MSKVYFNHNTQAYLATFNKIEVELLETVIDEIINSSYVYTDKISKLELIISILLYKQENFSDLYEYISEDFIDGLYINSCSIVIINNELRYNNPICSISLFDAINCIYKLYNKELKMFYIQLLFEKLKSCKHFLQVFDFSNLNNEVAILKLKHFKIE